ncbi:MAG TPA: hypothetical protein VGR13_04815 [Actinomycetota bacterium]|nr:hypothetical protein [Actinomycetota bacterium]
MSIDFAALTQAVVAGLPDVRSCLIVSRDGLALGASPATEEGRTLDVWTRIAALGEVERGFVTVRDEVWVFCRRGAYGAVATAPSTARPGLILDSLEQMVLMAEESRVRKEGVRPAPERETPSADSPRRMRTTLHRERAPAPASPEEKLSPEAQEVAVSAWARRLMRDRAESESEPASAEAPEEISLTRSSEAEAEASDASMAEDEGETRPSRDDSLVDRVELSREFAGILAEQEEDEE